MRNLVAARAVPCGAQCVDEPDLRRGLRLWPEQVRGAAGSGAEASCTAGAAPSRRMGVLILDHHEGYIDWDVYQSNQTMIAHNDNARGGAVRGPVKHGEALLAGLLRCG